MTNPTNKKLSLALVLFGITTLTLGLFIGTKFPKQAELPEGFKTPIIAFEFAKTEVDLAYLTGNGKVEKSNREMMDAGHVWDMYFPIAYGGFVFLLLIQNLKAGQRIAWLGTPFALLIIPFDINENLNLIGITAALESSTSPTDLLGTLPLATWLKWGSIGIATGVLAIGLFKNKEIWSATVALLMALGVGVCWASDTVPLLAEIMAKLIAVFFLFFTVKVGIHNWKNNVNN